MSSEIAPLVERAIETVRRARMLAGDDTWCGPRADRVVDDLRLIERLLTERLLEATATGST